MSKVSVSIDFPNTGKGFNLSSSLFSPSSLSVASVVSGGDVTPGVQGVPPSFLKQTNKCGHFESALPVVAPMTFEQFLDSVTGKRSKKHRSDAYKKALAYFPEMPIFKALYGSLLCMSEIGTDSTTGRYMFCGRRWCPVCSRRKSAERAAVYVPVIRQMMVEGHEFYTLVLTMVNCTFEELPVRYHHFTDWFRGVTDARRKYNKRNGLPKFTALMGIETTAHKGKGFHPHMHILVRGYADAVALFNSWIALHGFTGDNTAVSSAQHLEVVTDLDSAVMEVVKYTGKTISFKEKELSRKSFFMDCQMYSAMAGKRMFKAVGEFYGLMANDEAEKVEAVAENIESPVIISARWHGDVSNWLHSYDAIDISSGEIYAPAGSPLVSGGLTCRSVQLGEMVNEMAKVESGKPSYYNFHSAFSALRAFDLMPQKVVPSTSVLERMRYNKKAKQKCLDFMGREIIRPVAVVQAKLF